MADKKNLHGVPFPVVHDALMRFEQVSGVVNLGRSAVYARIRQGTFPAPVRLGARCVRWRASDIQAFIDAQTK